MIAEPVRVDSAVYIIADTMCNEAHQREKFSEGVGKKYKELSRQFRGGDRRSNHAV